MHQLSLTVWERFYSVVFGNIHENRAEGSGKPGMEWSLLDIGSYSGIDSTLAQNPPEMNCVEKE